MKASRWKEAICQVVDWLCKGASESAERFGGMCEYVPVSFEMILLNI